MQRKVNSKSHLKVFLRDDALWRSVVGIVRLHDDQAPPAVDLPSRRLLVLLAERPVALLGGLNGALAGQLHRGRARAERLHHKVLGWKAENSGVRVSDHINRNRNERAAPVCEDNVERGAPRALLTHRQPKILDETNETGDECNQVRSGPAPDGESRRSGRQVSSTGPLCPWPGSKTATPDVIHVEILSAFPCFPVCLASYSSLGADFSNKRAKCARPSERSGRSGRSGSHARLNSWPHGGRDSFRSAKRIDQSSTTRLSLVNQSA